MAGFHDSVGLLGGGSLVELRLDADGEIVREHLQITLMFSLDRTPGKVIERDIPARRWL